ncbi:acyl-CoA dehydrogenase, partial [Chryseobacterium phosphatilyticum]
MAASARIAEPLPLDVAGIVRETLRPRLGAIDAGDYPAAIPPAPGAPGAYGPHAARTTARLPAAAHPITAPG